MNLHHLRQNLRQCTPKERRSSSNIVKSKFDKTQNRRK